MWQSDNGRDTLPPWGNPSTAVTYAVGERVFSGDCAGTVHAVGCGTIEIIWSDGEYGPITYPVKASFLRKAMPWE